MWALKKWCLTEVAHCTLIYYIPINDTPFELSDFWLFDTESPTNKLRFSDSLSLSFKTQRRIIKSISSMEPETENMMTKRQEM